MTAPRHLSAAGISKLADDIAKANPTYGPSVDCAAAVNETEQRFLDRLKSKGPHFVVRSGWPDFLLKNEATGRVYGVEVKSGDDVVKPSQRRTFAFLEGIGIQVFIWWSRRQERLIPWRSFAAARSRYMRSRSKKPSLAPDGQGRIIKNEDRHIYRGSCDTDGGREP